MAALGGMYSSTATTVVLARQNRVRTSASGQAQAGITLATAIMYLRILVVVSVFNWVLARTLLPWFAGLSVCGAALAALQFRLGARGQTAAQPPSRNRNPLELGPAALFAALFVATSLLSTWVEGSFGVRGIYALAAVVGVTDIDPFVLNVAQGSAAGLSMAAQAAAVLIAASSNNVLKAGYALAFGGWACRSAAGALAVLALAGVAIAIGVLH